MKTALTKQLEEYIYQNYVRNKMSVYGCCEVKVGVGYSRDTEIVDYLIYDRTANEYRAYEIKSSIADLKSKHKLSFVGHKNYLVTTPDVYNKACELDLIPFNCGIILLNKGVISKSSSKTLSMAEQVMLLESLMRSLHREVNKNRIQTDYKALYLAEKECNKALEDEFENLERGEE